MPRPSTGRQLTALLALCTAASCGADAPSAPRDDPAATATSITVTADDDTLDAGSTAHLHAAVRNGLGAELAGRRAAWASLDTAVAVVSPEGEVTARAPGLARIIAAAEAAADTVELTIVARYRAMSIGSRVCAIATVGGLYCWGGLPNGLPDAADPLSPVRAPGDEDFRSLVTDHDFVCALTNLGAAYCLCTNVFGQLGTGDRKASLVPVPVTGAHVFTLLASGGDHSCGLTTTGELYCWGASFWGQLGDGDYIHGVKPVPVPAAGGAPFAGVGMGEFSGNCGIRPDRTALCWGANDSHQLGIAATTSLVLAPRAMDGGLRFQSLDISLRGGCGVVEGGAAYCWGTQNGYPGPSPVPVPGGLSFATVSASAFHACGLTTAGDAYCWGHNENGQLGSPALPGDPAVVATPRLVPIPGAPKLVAIDGDDGERTCALSVDGIVYCWGAGAAPSSLPYQRVR